MNVNTSVEIDRETHSVIAQVEGYASLHFGHIYFSEFASDIVLTKDEQEIAEEALREVVRYDGINLLSEQEPDARRRDWR
jgi:hypothetical protein